MSEWDGSPNTLKQSKTESMAQTVDGSMIFLYANLTGNNSKGNLKLASGGAEPEELIAEAGINRPEVIIRNWGGNNLNVSNESVTPVDIYIAAYGQGLNPPSCTPFSTGNPAQLSTMQCATTTASPKYMTLRFLSQASTATIFAVIGGPSTNGINAYVFGLNFPNSSGPPPDNAPPAEGYYQTTDKNSIDFQFNWGPASPEIWVVNLSAQGTPVGQVSIIG